jgi:hypothetical protein
MRLAACCTVVVLAFAAAAAEQETDQLARDALAVLKEQRDVLKTVKDRETAEKALPKLKALAEREKKVEKALQKLSREEMAAFRKKHGPAGERIARELDKEFARVEALPGAHAVLRTSPLFESRRLHKEKVARLGVKILETTLEVYKLTHGEYPDTLTILTQKEGKKPAYLEPEALKDPWGRPYVYDPKTLDPKTGKPLIYSRGADPKDPKARISNFVPKKKSPGK